MPHKPLSDIPPTAGHPVEGGVPAITPSLSLLALFYVVHLLVVE